LEIRNHISTNSGGKGVKGYVTRAPADGGFERGCDNFFVTEIYKNAAGCVEAGMGMEGQIMCIGKCTF